jgi:formate hydrogenlyase subunit 6/NADH:ubiquinone oxidoreductase subunit I
MSGVIDVSRRVPDRLTLLQRLYIPEILRGMSVTLRHLVRNLANMKGMPTILYPEKRRNYSGRFRGKHILKSREDGTLKCVACYMCPPNASRSSPASTPRSRTRSIPSSSTST